MDKIRKKIFYADASKVESMGIICNGLILGIILGSLVGPHTSLWAELLRVLSEKKTCRNFILSYYLYSFPKNIVLNDKFSKMHLNIFLIINIINSFSRKIM